ncbi:short-chain dehydrogenase [Mycolicibacterium cosmeticum]|uniref:Short-chain dehydrogenase n=1 Tax=Mycolicibacterium cosmeticum TaxID=258533 RepID=W9ARQ1_MYCCO|nr:short-chain dehydrogenase [Mycolicibacterium cosmeticum]
MVAGPVPDVSTEQWRKWLEINTIGQLAATRAVLPRPRGSHGRVVFTSSIDGRLSAR